MSAFQFAQIGVIRSPYKEKFAVPRQPGLVKHGGGASSAAPITRPMPYAAWKLQPSVGPVCVSSDHGRRLASDRAPSPSRRQCADGRLRHPFDVSPNPIGMSLVELKGIRCQKDQVILELGSLDLVDGTPVVDIKPYLPFAEALPDASASYAQQAPQADMASVLRRNEAQLLHLEKRYPH
jgi:tRNA (Thr-GGU) A37 N-methylase